MEITKGVIKKPWKVLIYGPEGIGKTTFASRFPDPLFIDTEGSTTRINVARLPVPTTGRKNYVPNRYVQNRAWTTLNHSDMARGMYILLHHLETC